jgi:hypothetical protein
MCIVVILHWSVKSELLTNSCYEGLPKRIVSWKLLVGIILNNCICRKWKIICIQVIFIVMSVCFFASAVVFSVVYNSVSGIMWGPYRVCSVVLNLIVVIFMKTYLFWCRWNSCSVMVRILCSVLKLVKLKLSYSVLWFKTIKKGGMDKYEPQLMWNFTYHISPECKVKFFPDSR